jgi:hypothetical protein
MKIIVTVMYVSLFLFNITAAQVITSKTAGGLWSDPNTWIGGVTPTQNNDVLIDGLVQLDGNLPCKNLTVSTTGILENKTVYGFTLTVNGSIVNNGIIRLNLVSHWANYLGITVSGNITNNGTWTSSQTTFSGNTIQELALQTDKIFEGTFSDADSTSNVKAKSNLRFNNVFDLGKSNLDMQQFSLTLEGSGNIFNGKVINTKDIYIVRGAHLSEIRYIGNSILHGLTQIKSGVVFEGTLTVIDTLQNQTSYGHVLTVEGDVINNGVIRANPYSHWANYLGVSITGNVTNNGTWVPSETMISGNGERTIYSSSIQGSIRVTGEKVIFIGDNLLPGLLIDDTADCIVASGAVLSIDGGTITGKIDNWGKVKMPKIVGANQNFTFYNLSANILSGSGLDSITVETIGHQVPITFANALKEWWEIIPVSNTIKTTLSSLTMLFSDDLLGKNDEQSLQVFHSEDSGKTWVQLSTSLNTSRNTNDNSVTITDVPAYGIYLLCSNADPVSVRPSIITAIIGRTGIRIGAPSRYTVHFVNNSDIPAEDFLLAVNTGFKVHINQAEITLVNGDKLVLPKDSLFYDNEDTTAVFYILKMAPREERTFDLIVVGDVPLNTHGKNNILFVDPVSLSAAAAVTWVAWKAGTFVICKGIDYLGDKFSAGIKLSAEEQMRYDQMVKGGIPTELEQQPGKAKIFGIKTVGGMVLKKTLELAPAGESAAQITYTITQNVKKVAPNLRQRIFNWFYKEAGLYGVEETESGNTYQPAISSATQKKGQLVRAWDPNEKVGPEGFGDQKFITSAGKMMYQILFENKKEATAPAYKIVIIDTLRSEFDPETVEFNRTSHEGFQYQWKKTKEGNIIKWEIEGIELPPNVNPPEGEGWVSFSVNTKNELPSGTILKNTATIIFDVNPPLSTNEYINTLDFQAPITQMNNLTTINSGKNIVVKWNTIDKNNGSGVESVTLYSSIDDGAYYTVGTTNGDSLVITTEEGSHKYSFYALAKDFVGNVESSRPAIISSNVVNSVSCNENIYPNKFSLNQNYPNPFNPTTIIEYSVPKYSHVSIKIYDILGKEVSTLVNEKHNAGLYKVEWFAKNVTSGTYFYQMKADNFISVKKLIFIK